MTDKTKPAAEAQRDALLLEIAERHLFVETLETRNSDSLDFHEHAVWAIRSALEVAYECSRQHTEAFAGELQQRHAAILEI